MWYMNKENEKLRKQVREFARTKVRAHVSAMEDNEANAADLLKEMGQRGWNFYAPKEVGGSGRDFIKYGIVLEEIAKESPTVAFLFGCIGTIYGILDEASPEQQEKYLKPLMQGKLLIGAAGNEATNANWLDGYSTHAVKDGNEWVLNGSKIFITESDAADYMIAVAITKDHVDLSKGKDSGLGLFVVSTKNPGYSVGHIENKIGLHGSRTGSVYFNNLRVADEDRIEDPMARYAHGEMIGFYSALDLGAAEALVKKTKSLLKNRLINGVSLWDAHETMHNEIGKLEAKINSYRNTTYGFLMDCNTCVEDPETPIEGYSAKVVGDELLTEVANRCMMLVGGIGVIHETGLEMYLRDAMTLKHACGSDEALYSTIGEFENSAEEEQTKRENKKIESDKGLESLTKLIDENLPESGKSDIVLVAGRGVSEEAWGKLQELAKHLGATIGVTRSFLDWGLTKNRDLMIGISGKTISPKLVINFGISGATQFTSGIANAKKIASVNNSAAAPIFLDSDLSIIGDDNQVIADLLDNYKAREGNADIFKYDDAIVDSQFDLDAVSGASKH